MKSLAALCGFTLCFMSLHAHAHAADTPVSTSKLWGASGENWTPQSRLPFFGRAGYRGGAAPIPDVKVVTNVRDFGATGDGATDDSAAILRALAATQNGALLFPAGRYVLRDVMQIERSNLILRGEGPGKSVLVMPQSLEELQGIKMAGSPGDEGKSSFSFGGGFVRIQGRDNGKLVAKLARPARRGDRVLQLAPTEAGRADRVLAAGNVVRLRLKDSDHALGRHLHADLADAGTDTYASRKSVWIDWPARVAAVDGDRVTLDRPLRLDAHLEWQPEVWSSAPNVSEVGVEGLGFEFAGKPKKKHLLEEGFNAIHITGAANCWVRDVTVTDADIGVIIGGNSRDCTVQNVKFLADKRSGTTGHHALWATGGADDCLWSDFEVATIYVHDLTVEGMASGNVFERGRGVAMNFDHHRNAPYENLFTDIDVGDARRVWESSGRTDRGPHSAARATFWNIRADKGAFPSAPAATMFPQINIIGLAGLAPDTTPDGPWVEPLDGAVVPANLYEAQRGYELK